MPIVISEFEIVADAPPETQAPPTQPPAKTRLPSPYEVALALAHELRREARVKAD